MKEGNNNKFTPIFSIGVRKNKDSPSEMKEKGRGVSKKIVSQTLEVNIIRFTEGRHELS